MSEHVLKTLQNQVGEKAISNKEPGPYWAIDHEVYKAVGIAIGHVVNRAIEDQVRKLP